MCGVLVALDSEFIDGNDAIFPLLLVSHRLRWFSQPGFWLGFDNAL